MNHVYRIVWSTATSSWVVASELATGDTRGTRGERRALRRALLVAGIGLSLGAPPAWSQALHWDGTDTNANANGGNGTWNNTLSNWDTAATGGANAIWSSALPNDAVFGGAGNVTIDAAGVTARGLTFTGTGYTFTGGPLTLSGTDPTVATNSGATNNLNVTVAGSNGLVKTGVGILSLNAANTYTGVTRVQEGRLRVGNAQGLGLAGTAASNLLISNGARIDFVNATYAHNFTALDGGTVTLGGSGATWAGTPTLLADTTLSLAGTITLSGNLTDNGGVLSLTSATNNTLGGTNTYSGPTRLTGGVLTLASMASLSPNSNLVFDAASDALLTLPGNFLHSLGTGADQVRWIGSGGFLSTTAGTKTVDLGGAALTWGVTPNFLASNTTLNIGATNGSLVFANALALPNAGTDYTVRSIGTFASHGVLSGTISGAGNLLSSGSITGFANGFLELTGANTFTGALILAGAAGSGFGNVMVSGAQSLPNSAALRFAGGAASTGNTLVLTAGSGNFTRALGTGANQVQWTGNGGFSAAGGARTVDIGGAGATLTWNSGGFVPTNSWLVMSSGGNSDVILRNGIDFNGAQRTIYAGTDGTTHLAGVLSNGGVQLRGGGTVLLEGTNTYTGVTGIGASTEGATVVNVATIGNGGSAGNLGAAGNAASNIVLTSGSLQYTGAGETTDRNLTIGTGGGSLLGSGTGALAWNGITSLAGANTLALGGTSAATVVNRVDGTIANGAGTLTLDKLGSGTWRLNGANTYTGATRISAGTLEVGSLANGGAASGLGASSATASNLLGNGGTLRYVGAGAGSTDRGFQLANNFRIDADGGGAMHWTSTTPIAILATGNISLFLGGANTGDNSLSAALRNHASSNNTNQTRVSLVKVGGGAWWLGAIDAGYTGNTTLSGGLLVAQTNSGINGGFGATSNSTIASGYTSLTPGSSLIAFAPGAGDTGGVLGLTAGSGDFTRALTTAVSSFDNNGTGSAADDRFIQGVRWSGSGGFAAFGGTRVVDLGGAGAQVTWATNGFVPTGSNLILGDATADGTLDFRNAIALAGSARTIETRNGSAAVDGILSGVLSGTGTSNLVKTGDGTLALTANNTYQGTTTVSAGTLQIGNNGTTGSVGASATTVAAGATLSVNRSDNLVFNSLFGGAGTFRQAGTGTTTLNAARTIGGVEVFAGALDTTAAITTQTLRMGVGTLRVGNVMQAAGGAAATLDAVAGTASTLEVQAGATLRADGSLGDGNDVLTLAGTLDSTTGLLLGDGDDTLTIVDGSDIANAAVDGGNQALADTVVIDNALALSAGKFTNFERLRKTGAGAATLTGNHAFTQGIALEAGSLVVDGTSTANTVAMGANTTLRVDGVFGVAGTPAALTGDAGAQQVVVDGTAHLTGNLGDGADRVEVASGLLSTQGGGLFLGAGNDTVVLRDGAVVDGTLDGGAGGTDVFDQDIAGTATVGAVTNFETLTKTGVGTLVFGSGASSFQTVNVDAGRVQVAGGASVGAPSGQLLATTVAAGGTLQVDGTYGCGAGTDSITVSGTLAVNGTIDQCGGDDTLTVRDGATFTGTGSINGGAQGGIGDTLRLEFTGAQSFGAGNVTGYEILTKANAGEATLTGTQSYATRVNHLGGTLAVAGSLQAPQIVLASGTTLAVRTGGTVEGVAGAAATLTGSGGVDRLVVAAGGTLVGSGNLGGSNDIVDVAGTIDTRGGTLALGSGNDELRVYDTTDLRNATMDGGLGDDLLDFTIGTGATVALGSTTGFESLGKSGLGTMEVHGDNSFASVRAAQGVLEIVGAGSVEANILDVLAAGTMRIDGDMLGTSGADVFTIAGTLAGGGTFDLGDGDDRLVLQAGANSAALSGSLEGGTGVDTVEIGAGTFAPDVVEFEHLRKGGAGTATVNGSAAFATQASVDAGSLVVGGTLEAPVFALADGTTLDVDGTATGTAGGVATVSGSTGANTLVVGSGGTLRASGSLGDGADTFELAGTLDTGAGNLSLGNGNDTFILHDGADAGHVDGGAGADTFNTHITTTATLGAATGFERLDKTGAGNLLIAGPAGSQFEGIAVNQGLLHIAGSGALSASAAGFSATVASAATLRVDGGITGSAGDDTLRVDGRLEGAGTIALGDGVDRVEIGSGAFVSLDTLLLGAGDDVFVLGSGATLGGRIDGGAGNDVFDQDIATTTTVGAVVGFETLDKAGVGTLVFGSGASTFEQVDIHAGTVRVASGASLDAPGTAQQATDVAAGATLQVDGRYGCGTNADSITVSGRFEVNGTVDQCGGDDLLTLRDGATLAGTGTIDGGAHVSGDRLRLDIAGAQTFGASLVAGYEILTKTSAGNATLTGTQTYANRVDHQGGTLTVAGTLRAPQVDLASGTTLDVLAGGRVEGLAGSAATLAGSAGADDILVEAGAVLVADGDLGDGDDRIDVAGTIDTRGGTLALGAGDDELRIHDTTNLQNASIEGGLGNDMLDIAIGVGATVTLGSTGGFESLGKSGLGTMLVDGGNTFLDVRAMEGALEITNAGSVTAGTLDVFADGTVKVDGALLGTTDDDVFTVAGTLAGAGTIDLGAGEDLLVLRNGADSAALTGAIDGGDDIDTVQLDAGTFSPNVRDFEHLRKLGAGTATLDGAAAFALQVAVDAGTLVVDGTLEAPVFALADGTAMEVDGTASGTAGAHASVSGSAGANTLVVAAGGTLRASGSLGDGADVFELAGTLDTGTGNLSLGAGNDVFTLHDGADAGNVDGGAGDDTFNTHITASATLGAATGFEGLDKTGTGTLVIAGIAESQFAHIAVREGLLDIDAGGAVLASTAPFSASVGSGATLRVDGRLIGSTGDDTLLVEGRVEGTGTIALGDGLDTLTLRDGAVLANLVDGGVASIGDTVVLDTTTAQTFDGAQTVNFESLRKTGAGEATVTGNSAYATVRLDAGTLAVQGTLGAGLFQLGGDATLRVDGFADGTIAGSAGVDTVVVSAGATLLTDGNLGAGDDVLDVAGRLDTASGTLRLGDGDDRLLVHDTTSITGSGGLDAGAGNDTLDIDVGNGRVVPVPGLAGFESLGKRGLGTLELAGQSAFEDVTVAEGLVHVTANGALAAQQLVVESAGVLRLDGDFAATAGDDRAVIAGTVAGPGAFGLGNGNDTLELRDGADLSALAAPLDGGAGLNTLQTDIATNATLGSVVNFQDLLKTNAGTLAIAGPASTTFQSVNVQGGSLAIGASGRLEGVASTTVAQGTTMRIDGLYAGTAADDLFVLAGALQGDGMLAFGAGRDTLQLGDGASIAMASAIDGGDGNDALVADVSTSTAIGALTGFESLQKYGTGTLRSTASHAFAMADVFEGVLAIEAGTTFTSQATTIAAGATLDIAGAFNGTSGDDTFTTAGSVRGALAFGDGNDQVYVTGGPLLPRELDGGAGNDDRLVFDNVQLDDASVAGLRGWEHMALAGDSQLTLSTALDGASQVALAAGTVLFARPGAAIAGTLSNGGAVHVGDARLAIGGDYAAGPGALLHVLVSPSRNSAGGLDVAGNITGVTSILFDSDGSAGDSIDSILVVDSPNDTPGDGGFVLGDSPDGFVRVQGSPFAWTFGQADDNRWYLDTEASQLAPEVPGYGIVGNVAFDALRTSQQALSGHLDAIRGLRECDRGQGRDDAAVRLHRTDCNGAWMSVVGNETRTDAGPGVAYSGDAMGLYIGMDGTAYEDDVRELRVGGYAGTAQGNYWTTGGDPLLSPDANVRLDGPAFGAYAELAWARGAYVGTSLVHQRLGAEVTASDGFRQRVDGDGLLLVHQAGWRLNNGAGWSLVPHAQVGIAETQWDDVTDASGKALDFIDDTTVQLRAALRVERTLLSDAGVMRPWFTVGLEDTRGEARSTVSIGQVEVPGERLRQRWTFDAGMEATLHAGVSLFGALGVSREVNGTSKETGQARAGVRWAW